MAKKTRPDPITQGVLLVIWQKFMAPLLKYKPDAVEMRDYLEYLFDYRNRDITRYEVARAFDMPGLFYETSTVKIQGIGYRHVPMGAELYVRQDARNPDNIDIEWVSNVDDQVFCLTNSQWNHVAPFLREAEKKRAK